MTANSPTLRRTLLLYLLIPLSVLWIFSAVVTYFIARNYANIAYDRALNAQVDYLVTRNPKDFKDALVRVLQPGDLLALFSTS